MIFLPPTSYLLPPTRMQHIGFIMDGNRRWAKKLGNLIKIGHENGEKTFEKVVEWCYDADIPFVSFWALSKENIEERSSEEIEGIYAILRSSISRLLSLAEEKNMRIESVWDLWLLPADIRASLIDGIEKTRNNAQMTIILALAYSGQDEIIRGLRRYTSEWHDVSSLDEKKFLEYLDSGRFPPPDLIVRTGWAMRHSGYFLYQSAYSEYYFIEKMWPDFTFEDFRKCIDYFASIKRNFWK